jgi:uncharacterized phage-associated protein
MLDCLDIAKYFIARAYADGREFGMTNMKVQKLLYYTQSIYLALQEEPLFSDDLQAWRYGPVCPKVYRFYQGFEAQQLPIPQAEDYIKIFSVEERQLLDEVWRYFGEYHAYLLSDMTHQEFPWKKARKGLPAHEASQEPISISDLKLLGEEKLREIESNDPEYRSTIEQLLKNAFSNSSENQLLNTSGDVRDWLSSLLD